MALDPPRTLPERFASDPRMLPCRGDIAAGYLSGKVAAKRFVAGRPMLVRAGSASLRKAPDAMAEQVNQALFGESFTVFDEAEGWVWGQLSTDNYVGWMRADDLGSQVEATHRVKVLRSFIFSRPDMKSTPLLAVSMNSRLTLGEVSNGFARVQDSGWIFARHASPVSEFETDFVGVAERFVGSPYLWGGRESAGIDCSGLVQVSLQATGRNVLRDSDMQEQTLGEKLETDASFSGLKRGDLIFRRGHVGMMCDSVRLLHASARDLHVEIEPLAEAVARIRPIAGEVRSVRRL
jgi:cell wall-associated NlpC family hydrolase